MSNLNSARLREETPHITDALKRRAQSIINDKSIDAETRAIIRYGLEINDPIHAKMYDAIAGSDIIPVDLTGVRPNVCVEAGFALNNHEKNRLIFIFQPSSQFTSVPFDLNTFRYEPFKDTGEIPDKIKPHINSILQSVGVGR